MQSEPSHGGDLSHVSKLEPVHRSRMSDPASQRTRQMFGALSASSVGLELGVSVLISLLIGMWMDRELGTEPWFMLGWLVIGFIAGFRGVLRAVRRADREVAG
jgi:F0F1-type ATP synthase assembly protein I